jgi:hypothetical protein
MLWPDCAGGYCRLRGVSSTPTALNFAVFYFSINGLPKNGP